MGLKCCEGNQRLISHLSPATWEEAAAQCQARNGRIGKEGAYILLPNHNNHHPPPRHNLRHIPQPHHLPLRLPSSSSSPLPRRRPLPRISFRSPQVNPEPLNSIQIQTPSLQFRQLRLQVIGSFLNLRMKIREVSRVIVGGGRFRSIDADGAFLVFFAAAVFLSERCRRAQGASDRHGGTTS